MKNIIKFLLLIILFCGIATLSNRVFAATTSTPAATQNLKTIEAPNINSAVNIKWENFWKLFNDIPNVLFLFINIGLVAAYAYGGYVYLTASGDQTKEELAKKVFLFATIGLIIVYAAYVIIKQFFTLSGISI